MRQQERERHEQEAERYGGNAPLSGATATEQRGIMAAAVMATLIYGAPRALTYEQTVKAGGC